jgi:peroxiredoxin
MKTLLKATRIMLMSLALVAPIVGGSATAVLAQVPAGMELGPKVGAKAPAFSVTSTSGEMKTFETLKGRRGLVLVFVRSADWCPFCKLQLENLNSVARELDTLGWPMVAVSYDPTETLERFATANNLDYRLLSDKGSKAIDAFGIRNESVKGSARFDGIPHPIILFIGVDGTVRAKLSEQRYQDRPPSGLVLETAKDLG